MKLFISLQKPWLPNAKERFAAGTFLCDAAIFSTRDCVPLTATGTCCAHFVVVRDGRFTDGPITDFGHPIPAGTYVLEISSPFVAVDITPQLSAVIGPHGENMRGPLINDCCIRSVDERESEKMRAKNRESAAVLGASVYYARYVQIGQQNQAQYVPTPQNQTPRLPIDENRSRLPPAAEKSGEGLGWALVIMAIASIWVGWAAQRGKGRTGIAWAFFSFVFMVILYVAMFFAAYPQHSDPPQAWWTAIGLVAAFLGGILMIIVIVTLPQRRA